MKNVSAYLDWRKSKKDGKKMWYAVFRDTNRSPERKTVSLKTKNRSVAIQKLATMEREVALGLYDPWTDKQSQGVALVAALKSYEAACEREVQRGDIRPSHAGSSVQTARQFVRSLPPETRSDRVRGSDVDAFVWGYENENSRWQAFARVKRFLMWCHGKGYLRGQPIEEARRPDPPQRKPPRFLTEDEFARILAAASMLFERAQERGSDGVSGGWWMSVFVFAAYTGLRNGEIRHLRWADVDLAGGRVRVQATRPGGPGPLHGLVEGGLIGEDATEGGGIEAPEWPGFVPKWRKARTVPLLPEARRALLPVEEGGLHPYGPSHVLGDRAPHRLVWSSPHALRGMSQGRTRTGFLSRESLASAFRRAREAANVGDSGHTFHSLRHTYGSWLVQRGVPITHVQRVMGHKHVSTTEIYAAVSDHAAAASILGAFGGGGDHEA